MIKEHLFVNIMILLQVGAIGNYAFQKDWGLALYWFACMLINIVVTYVIGK
jgi:hypothetical protein